MNVSRKIANHYYGEVYDLKKKRSQQYKGVINMVETEKYIALLKLKKQTGINKIYFELHER